MEICGNVAIILKPVMNTIISNNVNPHFLFYFLY